MKEQQRYLRIKRRYGLSREQVEALFERQGHACALCRLPENDQTRWCIDHNHSCCPTDRTCGRCVRGILCANCNTIEGLVRKAARSVVDFDAAFNHLVDRYVDRLAAYMKGAS